MKKQCSKCNEYKPISEFAKNKAKRAGCASECKECHRIIRKTYYKNNQKRESSRVRCRKKEIQQWYQEYKSTLECIECGESHIATLDFHHRNPDEKEIMLSRVAESGWGKTRILNEMNKCDVLCSNCHKKLHYKQKKNNGAVTQK